MVDLGVMILAHHRPYLLPLIVRQLTTAWPSSCIQITQDRPTEAVRAVCEDLARKDSRVELLDSPLPAVAARENFMEVRSFQHQSILPRQPAYISIWDDDHVLEDTAEAKAAMKWGTDLIWAIKAFFWDSIDNVNTAMPEHRGVLFFKNRWPLIKDQFPLDRMIYAPCPLYDHHTSSAMLKSRLLDVGYLRESERQEVFRRYARAGKLDSATRPLVEPPTLQAYRWKDAALRAEIEEACDERS